MPHDQPSFPHRSCAAALLVLSLACGAATEPLLDSVAAADSVPPLERGSFTHPAGILAGKIPIRGRAFGVAVSARGLAVVTVRDSARLATFTLGASLPTDVKYVDTGPDCVDVVFDRPGDVAFLACNGVLDRFDALSGRMQSSAGYFPGLNRLARTPDDTMMFGTLDRGYLVRWIRDREPESLRLAGVSKSLVISPTSRDVYVGSTTDFVTKGSLARVDAATLRIRSSQTVNAIDELTMPSDESELWTNLSDIVSIRDPVSMISRSEIQLLRTGGVGALAATPDGEQIFMAFDIPDIGAQVGVFHIYDRRTRALLKAFVLGGVPRRIAFDRTGSTALVTNEKGWVDVIR